MSCHATKGDDHVALHDMTVTCCMRSAATSRRVRIHPLLQLGDECLGSEERHVVVVVAGAGRRAVRA